MQDVIRTVEHILNMIVHEVINPFNTQISRRKLDE